MFSYKLQFYSDYEIKKNYNIIVKENNKYTINYIIQLVFIYNINFNINHNYIYKIFYRVNNLRIDNIDYKPIVVDTGLFYNKFNDLTFVLPYFDTNQNVTTLNEINRSLSLTVDSGLNNPSLNEILNSDIGLLLDVSPFELNLNEILNLFFKVD